MKYLQLVPLLIHYPYTQFPAGEAGDVEEAGEHDVVRAEGVEECGAAYAEEFREGLNAEVGVVEGFAKEAEALGVIFRRIVRRAFVAVVESGEGYFIAYDKPAPVGFDQGAGIAEFGVVHREPVHQCLPREAETLRRVTLGDGVTVHEGGEEGEGHGGYYCLKIKLEF